jgi:predicted thioesterase
MELKVGLEGCRELVVSKNHLASFTGNENVDVLSTHRIVLLMELSARNAIAGRIPKGKINLGNTLIYDISQPHHWALRFTPRPGLKQLMETG